MKLQRGFTLIELMIAMAIIALLVAIAMPNYTAYVMRGKISEATTNLSSLRVNEEQSYQDNRNYGVGGVCTVAMPAGSAANIKFFTYTCASAANAAGVVDQTYIITATGGVAGGDNSMAGFVYTIDQNNNKTTVIGAPVKTATWGTGNPTCWITKPNAC